VKTIFKPFLILLGIIFSIGIIYLFSIYFTQKAYNERVRKIAHVDIYQKEIINNLKLIEFNICDSIYYYKSTVIKDTICENLAISDRILPCSVKIKYLFKNGDSKTFELEKFNCGGCSGTNSYGLKNNYVDFEYIP